MLPFDQHWDYSAAGVRRSIEDSLQRLGLARIDVAYVHDCDAATHGARAAAVLRQVLDETLPALQQLQARGPDPRASAWASTTSRWCSTCCARPTSTR